jgi:hypothetical protein
VKQAFDERKLVDPYFNKTNMNVYRGDKAMATHWGIMQTACSKWHGIQEEVEERPISGHDLEQKVCSVDPASPRLAVHRVHRRELTRIAVLFFPSCAVLWTCTWMTLACSSSS